MPGGGAGIRRQPEAILDNSGHGAQAQALGSGLRGLSLKSLQLLHLPWGARSELEV